MEKCINELSNKVALAYSSCSLRSVNAFNPYKFEKMLDVLSTEYLNKGLDNETFVAVVNDTLSHIGGLYVYKK